MDKAVFAGTPRIAAAIADGIATAQLRRENQRLREQNKLLNDRLGEQQSLVKFYRSERLSKTYRRPPKRKNTILRRVGLWMLGAAIDCGFIVDEGGDGDAR